MQQITQFIVLCSFFIPQYIYANSKGPSIKEALEITVNQQILSQKIAKNYLTLCHDIRNPKLYQDRSVAIEQFEEQLYQLSLFIPNERVKGHIQEVRAVWKRFKAVADWSIKKEAVHTLLSQAKELLKASKMLHSAYQEYEYTIKDDNNWITINQYINQVQYQKVLVQRILTYYMANIQDPETLDYSIELEVSQKSFVRILVILENAATTSTSIKESLRFIRKQWESILKQMKGGGNEINALYQVLTTGEVLEENIQNVIDSYAILRANLSLSYTIQKGAKQCILVQQMATNYVASKHQDIKYVCQQKIVKEVADFERNIESMLLTASTFEIKEAVGVVKTMWKNYKKLLTDFETMNTVQIFKTLEQASVVMAACDQVNKRIKLHAETVFAYQKILPQNNKNTLMSEDIITQIELVNQLKVVTQRTVLYFMMKSLNWDIALSVTRFDASNDRFELSIEQLNINIEEPNRRVLLAEIKSAWEGLSYLYKEGTTDDFLELVTYHQKLQQKLNKLSDACLFELNQLFAQDLELNY
jgi:DNA-directed RNA polymerase subunit L